MTETKDEGWQGLMRTYFQDADYHTLGAILRNWDICGTENQNGTWIDWGRVPEDCQNEVEKFVQTVVESRKEQKNWETKVRMIAADKKNQMVNEGGEKSDDRSFTYEEREGIDKSQQQSWVNRKGVPRNLHTMDEPTASQWVLDRVPYQLKNNSENQQKWKKIGSLDGYVVYDEGLIWENEEDDIEVIHQQEIWRKREEAWWKISPRENLAGDSKERVLRAQEWMKNRRKFSLHSQKIMKHVRDFVRSQGIRRHFLICPEFFVHETGDAEVFIDEEEEEEHVVGQEDVDEDPSLWCRDDEEEEDVWAKNPFQNRQTEEEEVKPKKKRKTAKPKKKKSVSEKIFSSGTAVEKK